MLHDVVEDPGRRSAADLLAAHTEQLGEVIRAVGLEEVAAAVDLPTADLAEIAEGDAETAAALDLEAVASIVALAEGSASPEAIAGEARDDLLFGMTAGVLNVDVVAGDVSVDIEPREVQAMVEGRQPMTLREYVALQRVIAGRGP